MPFIGSFTTRWWCHEFVSDAETILIAAKTDSLVCCCPAVKKKFVPAAGAGSTPISSTFKLVDCRVDRQKIGRIVDTQKTDRQKEVLL